jgi:tRNA1(Val) A37 N6-methylase TrmN6
MSGRKHIQVKNNGIFYTPEHVAALLAAQAITKRDISILDPACGEGSLLTAAMEECKRYRGKQEPYLVGCDRFKQRNLDRHIKFIHLDFFTFHTDEQFDLILTNPPYIQSARIDSTIRNRYYERYARPLGLSSNLDLWVYFLIKCTAHLKKGGAIAAVLPWSFLEAEYAQKIRKRLAENFAKIQVLVLQGAHFKDTVKRVLLVWLKEYGAGAQSIKLGYADKCNSKPYFHDLSVKIWNSENAMAGLIPETSDIIRRLQEAGFRPFEEYANVSIGVVTGANKYFILTREEAEEAGFSQSSILPVLTSVEDLSLVVTGESPNKNLLQFQRMTSKRRKYVFEGLNLGFNERVHCQRREKVRGAWYDVDPGPVPHAFFTYRVSKIPYLLLNPDGYQCTNALHKVVFNGASETERKWIQLSLLSLFGQLCLEMGGRHYGNGIIKVEPKVLKRALVYACRTRLSKRTYENILQALCEGNKNKVCFEATRLVAREAIIDDAVIKEALDSLNEIRALRGAARLSMSY